jgi:hypothetical protein
MITHRCRKAFAPFGLFAFVFDLELDTTQNDTLEQNCTCKWDAYKESVIFLYLLSLLPKSWE